MDGKRREVLVAMVQRQIDRWPYHDGRRRFTSKTNMGVMRGVLLNRAFGFTKQRRDVPGPVPAAEHGQDEHEDLHEQEDEGEGERGIDLDAGGTPPGVRAQLLALEGSDGLAAGWGIFDSRGGTPVSVPDSDEDVRVNVYASFVRPNEEIERKAFFVQLTQATSVNGLTGEWQASTHQLVERLHAEVGDIEMAAEISYPAPEAPEYAQRLVAATLEANVLCAVPNAPAVHVAADNTVRVTVVYNNEMGGRRAVMCPPPPQLQLQPHQPAPGPSSGAPSASASPTVQWLIAEAAKDPRYASFKAGRHHVQTNPGVISSWQFAVEFSEKHSGMPHPVIQPTVGGRSRRRPIRIKKSEVQQALGIGSSWMSDAQRAVMILWKFGEGGTSPRQNVIAVCTSTAEDDRMGARALLEYLMEQLND
ncbi:hypothetical protein J3R83DRAFT_2517 [Lanmaoa asiatica]|nr:hypothetical protein J3R83DRAFT_2517 [Lanmaoa asiatica]